MKRQKFLRSISCFLLLCFILSAVQLPVFAIEWDGSSQGGGGGGTPAGPNGYAVRTTIDNCLGYRFSLVDKYGNTSSGNSIDIFRNTYYGDLAYSSAYKFNSKYNKKQLISYQNNGFGTSKTSTNCYKETNMGFLTSLPKPDGMKTWQNYSANLNIILNTLGISGGIGNLKNGDKIIVEPLYDVRLQGTYHSLTLTEIALYGKYILGVNSDGGTSSTSASWGFISIYTNQYYPNDLYTPDGQGLWTGVSSLSKKATFYTIINNGYGTAIAYTENKPNFTPDLNITKCEAWPGSTGSRTSHYGISYGPSFSDYTYGNGYPIMGDQVWFALNFPTETENIYVRQSVRLQGGSWMSRRVYSNNGAWFDIALSPSTVDANRSSYIVEAKADWLDESGNVKQYGAVKTFYIPIKPKINIYQVSMYDITGMLAARNGTAGRIGKLYVGQQVRPYYTFTSDNTWVSYNNLQGYLYEWINNQWETAKGTADFSVNNAAISKSSSYSGYSSLGLYQIKDTTSIPVFLSARWSSDPSHTQKSDYIDIRVIKADVELEEIRLIDVNGDYITDRTIYAYQTVTPQYTYRNNTDCTVYVEGYNDDNSRISGTFKIPPNSSINVIGKSMTVPYQSTFDVWGGVFLDGAGRLNTEWESDGSNNYWLRYWYVKNPLTIETIKPNSRYNENTEVISSFKVKNASLAKIIPNNNISVKFTVTKGSELLYTTTKTNIVIPVENENLVYFKWKVPKGLNNSPVTVKGEIIDNGKVVHTAQQSINTEVVAQSQTPDTQYQDTKPSVWAQTTPLSPYANSATWSEWIYSNGSYQKKDYGIQIVKEPVPLIPDSNCPSAELKNGVWNLKSGYGIALNYWPAKTTASGTLNPPSSAYTSVQSGYMQFPEFDYSYTNGKFRTLDMISGHFEFKTNSAANQKRIHFVPVWYPNGVQNYMASCYFYDLWTPAGMLSARLNTNSFTINGSMYDDYYIGRD